MARFIIDPEIAPKKSALEGAKVFYGGLSGS
jgi:hypothetical protein